LSEETLQRKITAIMFTDIVGYSRMMGENEAEALAFLQVHNTLIEKSLRERHGRVVKTIGDAFMVEFEDPAEAMRCAVDIQNAFLEYNQSRSKPRQVRIGIHIGEVTLDATGDLFGDAVNIAARIQPLAEPGTICVSHEFYSFVKDKVPLDYRSLGPQDLKNITRKVLVYQVQVGKARAAWVLFFQGLPWKGLLVIGAVGLLIWLGLFVAYPAFTQWQEDRGWSSWLKEDFQDTDQVFKRWDMRLNANYAFFQKGNLTLSGRYMSRNPVTTLQTISLQPFRMRVWFRSNDPQSTLRLTIPLKKEWVKTTGEGWESDRFQVDVLK